MMLHLARGDVLARMLWRWPCMPLCAEGVRHRLRAINRLVSCADDGAGPEPCQHARCSQSCACMRGSLRCTCSGAGLPGIYTASKAHDALQLSCRLQSPMQSMMSCTMQTRPPSRTRRIELVPRRSAALQPPPDAPGALVPHPADPDADPAVARLSPPQTASSGPHYVPGPAATVNALLSNIGVLKRVGTLSAVA